MTLDSLFDNYMEFEEIKNNKCDGKIDLRNLQYNPTAILPLLCECKNQNLTLTTGENAFDYLINMLKTDNLFSKLPESRIESDDTDFLTNYVENLDSEYGGYFVLRHVISELANNVYDHAKTVVDNVQSYILANLDDSHEKLTVCVIDDGLSIPGLFEVSNADFVDDCHAIEKAIGTFSTVSDTFYERGNGLRTIVRLIAEGNGGELLIVSRNGCVHICGDNYRYYLLDNQNKFGGTLISIRLNKYEVQNIYELLEPSKLNSFKYLV